LCSAFDIRSYALIAQLYDIKLLLMLTLQHFGLAGS